MITNITKIQLILEDSVRLMVPQKEPYLKQDIFGLPHNNKFKCLFAIVLNMHQLKPHQSCQILLWCGLLWPQSVFMVAILSSPFACQFVQFES